MKKFCAALALLLVAMLFGSIDIAAQDFRATVGGRITDQVGAAVSGTQVTITNTDTNQASSVVSNEEGNYVITALPSGTYRLKVERSGFKQFVREGIILEIRANPTVDVTLEAGDVSETVTVIGDTAVLETNDASRGTTITGQAIVDLPLNGRNAFALAALTPGVNFNSRGQTGNFFRTASNVGISSVQISGSQPRSNEVLLDGVPVTGSDGLVQFIPSVDATQEFKVQTNSFDSEFGRFTGGVINASIKSGTNDFHGSLFIFHRNSAFNARDPFATRKPQFTFDQLGGTIGGPIFFPRFGEGGRTFYSGRNRTFFFVSLEGTREDIPRTFVSTVPTLLQRQGIFTETSTVIFDPATTRPGATAGTFVRSPFSGNRIPTERLNPTALRILEHVPLPNAPGVVNNRLESYKDTNMDDGIAVKIDHNFTDRHRIFGRFTYRRFITRDSGALNNVLTVTDQQRYAPGFAFDDTYTLNATTVLNFRYGLSRFDGATQSGQLDPASLGFPAALVAQLPVPSLPRIVINGYTTLGPGLRFVRGVEDSHSFRGGGTKIVGNQAFRFGGEFRLLRSNNRNQNNQASGSYDFNANFTRGPNPVTPNTNNPQQALAAFLLGFPFSGIVQNSISTAEQSPYYGFYFQDDWRASNRLTLNLGLRYEFEAAYTERFDRFNRGFDATVASPIEAQALANYRANPIPQLPVADFHARGGLLFVGVGGQPRGLTNIDRNNFAPRIGVAYKLTDRTVLRGGYGLFYGATTQLSEASLGFSINTPFVGAVNNVIPAGATLSNPFPAGLLVAPGSSLGTGTLLGSDISFVDPNRKQPFAHQYQLSIQQELPGHLLLDAAYVGALGRDVAVNVQLNAIPLQFIQQARQTLVATGVDILAQAVPNPFFRLVPAGASLDRSTVDRGQLLRPFPQFTSVAQLNSSIGSYRYDAFQFKATRRFSEGFSLLTSYTFAKQLEKTRLLNVQDAELVKELSDFDLPHRLVVSSSYELPFGPGRRFLGNASGIGGKLLEGFQLNAIYQAQSGLPLTVSNAASTGQSAQLPEGERSVDRWFDTTAFRRLERYELVTTSRLSDVRSPGRNTFDLSLFKTTRITEGVRLQLRAEGFNLFNRSEFSSPVTDFNSPNFGRIQSTNIFNRQFQFGAKLLF